MIWSQFSDPVPERLEEMPPSRVAADRFGGLFLCFSFDAAAPVGCHRAIDQPFLESPDRLVDAVSDVSSVTNTLAAPGGAPVVQLSRYELLERIGQGGMGEVFRAVHRTLKKTVAVKLLLYHRVTPTLIDRFRREI